MKQALNTNKVQAGGLPRDVSLDHLRVIACFSVVILHLAAQNWHETDVNTVSWQVLNLYNGAVRWAVPVFVMVSGALFLDPAREVTVKALFRKNLFRIVCAFAFWSFLYIVIRGVTEGFQPKLIEYFIAGHYHMWFLFMIAGLYLITPFVRRITADQKLAEYFLILCLVFTFLVSGFLSLDEAFPISALSALLDDGRQLFDKMHFHFTLGFTGYYVLGYYLSRRRLPRAVVYGCGILGFAGTIGLSAAASLWRHEPVEYFFGSFTIPVLLESIFVFCVVRDLVDRRGAARADSRLIRTLSRNSFGIYLAHAMIIEMFESFGITNLYFSPILSIPVLAVTVFAISALISAALHCVPVLKKYVV